MRRCEKCGIKKADGEFCSDKRRKDGIGKRCKNCYKQIFKERRLNKKDEIREANKRYRLKNDAKIKEWKKQYRLNNKEKVKELKRQSYLRNKEYVAEYSKQYRKIHKEEKILKDKEYRENHKDEAREYQKSYRLKNEEEKRKNDALYYLENKSNIKQRANNYYFKNKDEIRPKQNKYKRQNRIWFNLWEVLRRKNNIDVRILHNLRTRVGYALKGARKSQHTIDLVGCAIYDLKIYLEKQFKPNMSWENYGQGMGKWNIDHITPCSVFNMIDPVEQKQCFHFSNLQPLWERGAGGNLSKNDKISGLRVLYNNPTQFI